MTGKHKVSATCCWRRHDEATRGLSATVEHYCIDVLQLNRRYVTSDRDYDGGKCQARMTFVKIM